MSVYIASAKILEKTVELKTSVKNSVYSSNEKDKKKLFALVCETLKYTKDLNKIVEETDLLNKYGWNEESRHQLFSVSDDINLFYLALPLLYDYLYGKGLGKAGRIRCLITKHKRIILDAFKKLKDDGKIVCTKEIDNRSSLPRYARVNTLKTTVKDAIDIFIEEGWKLKSNYKPETFCEVLKTLDESQFLVDSIIPEILAFPPRTDLHNHHLVESGAVILQDRASCFPAFVLDPPENSHVADCCAAPGNKTTHLAACMNNTGKIFAFDRSKERFETLQLFIKKAAANNTAIYCEDFLSVDPNVDWCENIEYLLVDPSCSGSGMDERRNDLTDDKFSLSKKRLRKLSRFQSLLLQHALSFPSAKKVVYSTCSVHEEENEQVVEEVLDKFKHKYELEYIIPEWKGRGNEGYQCSQFCLRFNTEKHRTNGFFIACFKTRDTECNLEVTATEEGDNETVAEEKHSKKKKKKKRSEKSDDDEDNVKHKHKRKRKHINDASTDHSQVDNMDDDICSDEHSKSKSLKKKKKKKKIHAESDD